MTDEQRAAIDRLRKSRDGGYLSYAGDEQTVADLYLTEHPADDAEPVTEEWMRSVGFYEDHTGCWLITEDDSGWLLAWNIDEDGHSGAGQWSFRGDDMPESCRIKTRGNVRRLCAALGVPLKSPVAVI